MNNYPTTPGYKTGGTSREAATAIVSRAATLRQQVFDLLIAEGPMSADQAAHRLGEDVLSVRPRFSELKKSRRIYDSGRRDVNASGKRAVVWAAVREYDLVITNMTEQAKPCRTCGTPIIWLRQAGPDKKPLPGAKPNPIEEAPHPEGNLVINREAGLYRLATGNERDLQKYHGKRLYISHFATCPGGELFRRSKETT